MKFKQTDVNKMLGKETELSNGRERARGNISHFWRSRFIFSSLDFFRFDSYFFSHKQNIGEYLFCSLHRLNFSFVFFFFAHNYTLPCNEIKLLFRIKRIASNESVYHIKVYRNTVPFLSVSLQRKIPIFLYFFGRISCSVCVVGRCRRRFVVQCSCKV